MARTMKVSILLFVSGSVAYLALLWGFRSDIFHSLYGNKFSACTTPAIAKLAVGLIPIARELPKRRRGGARSDRKAETGVLGRFLECGLRGRSRRSTGILAGSGRSTAWNRAGLHADGLP